MMGNVSDIYRGIDHRFFCSDDQTVNRLIQESIDGIYKRELSEIQQKVKTIEPDIQSWARNNETFNNATSTFYSRKRKM